MAYLIIDTSSMLFGFANGRNVFDIARAAFPGYGMLVSRGIVAELEGISENMGRRGLGARLALRELRAKKINVDNNREADPWIAARAKSDAGSVVITNDTALAKGLARRGASVFKLSRSGMLKKA